MSRLRLIKKGYTFYILITALGLALLTGACSDRQKTANVQKRDNSTGSGEGAGGGGYKPSPDTGYGTKGIAFTWALATMELVRYVELAMTDGSAPQDELCVDVQPIERQGDKTIIRLNRDACVGLRYNEQLEYIKDQNGFKSIKVARTRYIDTEGNNRQGRTTTVQMSLNLSGSRNELSGDFNFDVIHIRTSSSNADDLEVTASFPIQVKMNGNNYEISFNSSAIHVIERRGGRERMRANSNLIAEQLTTKSATCGHLQGTVAVNQEYIINDKAKNAAFKLGFSENKSELVGKKGSFGFRCSGDRFNRATMMDEIIVGVIGPARSRSFEMGDRMRGPRDRDRENRGREQERQDRDE